MPRENKKITIKEVARLAGVSKGTVDRVVHERGEVSEQSRAKVLEVIEQIGYKPNIYASMLASKRQYTILCLVPEVQSGEYWELVYNGIKRAAHKGKDYNVTVDVVLYDQFDVKSFRAACRRLLDANPSAVMLAPMYREETVALTADLNKLGIPFVFIDSKRDECNYLAYYGMPMYESGYLGGSLLLDGAQPKTIANIRIERGASPLDNPTLARREGFMAYLKEFSPETEVVNEYVRPYDSLHNLKVLDAFFEAHPDVHHIITFNSRVHLVAEYMDKRAKNDCRILGFDMLPKNIDALKRGQIKFLIAQRTETQVYRGINALIEHLILKKAPTEKDNYMSIDILTRENVPFYFDLWDI